MTEPSNQTTTTNAVWDRPLFRYFLFVVLLLDVVGVMVYQGHHRQLYENLTLIITGLASGVVTLVKFLGVADNGKLSNGPKSLDSLLGDHLVQIFIIFFTCVLAVLLRFPGFVSPLLKYNVTVYVDSDSTARDWGGELALYTKEGSNMLKGDSRAVRFNSQEVFDQLDPGGTYMIEFHPFDVQMFRAVSSKKLDANQDVRIPVTYCEYNVFYQPNPENSKLVVTDEKGEPHTFNGSRHILLRKGMYSYTMTIDSPDYDALLGTFYVPLDTLRLILSRKKVGVRFVANRGIKPNVVLVPASFTISQGSSVVKSSLGSGEQISLESDIAYTVEARGRDEWDLFHRVYAGSQKIVVFRTANRPDTTVYVRVKEVVAHFHSSTERR